MDPVSLAIVSMTGMVLLGTYLGYRVGVLKGKVDKIMPLLEAMEELREDAEKDREFDRTHPPKQEAELEEIEGP